jgi:hypothetical protein
MFHFPEVISDLIWSYAQEPKYKLLDWVPKRQYKRYYIHPKAESLIRDSAHKLTDIDWSYIVQNPACFDLIVDYFKSKKSTRNVRFIKFNPLALQLLKHKHINDIFKKWHKSSGDDIEFKLLQYKFEPIDLKIDEKIHNFIFTNSNEPTVDCIIKYCNENELNINQLHHLCHNINTRILPLIEKYISQSKIHRYMFFSNPIMSNLIPQFIKENEPEQHEWNCCAENPNLIDLIKEKVLSGYRNNCFFDNLYSNPNIFELDIQKMKQERLSLPLL